MNQTDYAWGDHAATTPDAAEDYIASLAATYYRDAPMQTRFVVLHQAPEAGGGTWLAIDCAPIITRRRGRREVTRVDWQQRRIHFVVGQLVGISVAHEPGVCKGCSQAWRVANGRGADVKDLGR